MLDIRGFFRELEGRLFKTHAQLYRGVESVQKKYYDILPVHLTTTDYLDYASKKVSSKQKESWR